MPPQSARRPARHQIAMADLIETRMSISETALSESALSGPSLSETALPGAVATTTASDRISSAATTLETLVAGSTSQHYAQAADHAERSGRTPAAAVLEANLENDSIPAGTTTPETTSGSPAQMTEGIVPSERTCGAAKGEIVWKSGTPSHSSVHATPPAQLSSTPVSAPAKTTANSALPGAQTNTKYRPRPVVDNTRLQLHKASFSRENTKAATIFAGNGRNLFTHHVELVLQARRKVLLSSGTTKKKFHKSAAQLWADLPQNEQSFWNRDALELRQCLKQGILTHEECVRDAGFAHQWYHYRQHAEISVANYLHTQLPTEFEADFDTQIVSLAQHVDLSLLPVLPEPFTYESKMMYGIFAHEDYDEIRNLEGREQTNRLRHLAEYLDDNKRESKAVKAGKSGKDGKELFYYYAVPHIWKLLRPPKVDETVLKRAHDLWRDMNDQDKNLWTMYKDRAKSQLGDGDVNGLVWLELDSLDSDVLKLHAMAVKAIGGGRGGRVQDR